MRKLLFLSLLLFLAAPVAAQEKCVLALADAPDFFGLRLQMTSAEVRGVFGKSLKMKNRKEGTFFQNFIKKPPPAILPGVRALYLRFFDYKLYQIEIFYQTENKGVGFDTQKPAALVDVLSTEKNLPKKFWVNRREKFQLSCSDFSLIVDNILNLRTELTDEATRTRFDQARERENESQNR